MPLEHSDLNDIESSVAQQKIRQELKELLAAIYVETVLALPPLSPPHPARSSSLPLLLPPQLLTLPPALPPSFSFSPSPFLSPFPPPPSSFLSPSLHLFLSFSRANGGAATRHLSRRTVMRRHSTGLELRLCILGPSLQVERIAEEKAQAARARALTDALQRGLKIVNRSPLPSLRWLLPQAQRDHLGPSCPHLHLSLPPPSFPPPLFTFLPTLPAQPFHRFVSLHSTPTRPHPFFNSSRGLYFVLMLFCLLSSSQELLRYTALDPPAALTKGGACGRDMMPHEILADDSRLFE